MDNPNPKISIITTFYNSVKLGDFVHRAMKSLLNQTYENIEFICVNDGSTDETLAHLKDYEKKDPRIIIINKKNEGVAQYAKAAGQDTASGDYIMLFDHDDQISHDAIENAINALSKNPDSDAVSMLVKTYYADGRVRNTYNLFEKISNLDNFKSVSIKGTDAYQLTVGRYDFHFRGLISKDKFKAISFRFPGLESSICPR
jgi:glycosyltransferase involved in cell wall biosynthesis